MPEPHELLSPKELAAVLKRHPSYVYAMVSLGFQGIAGRYTLVEALVFLQSHPTPKRELELIRRNGSRMVEQG